jgi:hypothetical protein
MFAIVQEREEETKRLKQLRLTEEAEAKRLANESARREEARIRKEIEEKDLEEARLLLAEAEKRKGKKGKKAAADGVCLTLVNVFGACSGLQSLYREHLLNRNLTRLIRASLVSLFSRRSQS